MKKYSVVAEWDDEAGVWFVCETDVPGLATEADTIDELVRKLKVMIPELLELNGVLDCEHAPVPFSFMADVSGMDGHC